jgi:hypothetical protein
MQTQSNEPTLEERVARLEQRTDQFDRMEQNLAGVRQEVAGLRQDLSRAFERIFVSLDSLNQKPAFRWPWEARP